MQASVPISFAALLVAVTRQPSSETPLPWALWCVAYILGLATVGLRWEGWPEAVYSANYPVWAAAVWFLCQFRVRSDKRKPVNP
jgi:hypothetical protein